MFTSRDEGRKERHSGMGTGTQRTSTIIAMYYFYVWMVNTEVHCIFFFVSLIKLVMFVYLKYLITYVESPPKKTKENS